MKCLESRYLFSGFDHAQEAGDREIEQVAITFCTAAISQMTAKEAKEDRDAVFRWSDPPRRPEPTPSCSSFVVVLVADF